MRTLYEPPCAKYGSCCTCRWDPAIRIARNAYPHRVWKTKGITGTTDPSTALRGVSSTLVAVCSMCRPPCIIAAMMARVPPGRPPRVLCRFVSGSWPPALFFPGPCEMRIGDFCDILAGVPSYPEPESRSALCHPLTTSARLPSARTLQQDNSAAQSALEDPSARGPGVLLVLPFPYNVFAALRTKGLPRLADRQCRPATAS